MVQQYTTSAIHTGTTEHLSVVARSCRNASVVSAEAGVQGASDPSSRVTVNITCRDCTISLGLPTFNLSSCINIPSYTTLSRGGRLGRLALPAAEVSAVSTANPAVGKRESSSGSISLGLLTISVSWRSSIPSRKTSSRPRKRLRRMALPAPTNVSAVSPAHQTGETDFVKPTRTDTMTLGNESRSGDTVSECCSGKKKVRNTTM